MIFMDEPIDFLQFYDDEHYLLTKVGPTFRETGRIATLDFHMILIWKADRAKGYHKARLRRLSSKGSYSEAVQTLASELWKADRKEQLRVLMTKWQFALPTASAILTILYPDEFTVYDYRVREVLGLPKNLSYRYFSDSLWCEYEAFIEAVNEATPPQLRLRDKDRYLSGKSYRNDVERDCFESV